MRVGSEKQCPNSPRNGGDGFGATRVDRRCWAGIEERRIDGR